MLISILESPKIFLDNKYTALYIKLVQHSYTDLYTEQHHIWPTSLGGQNIKSNKVKLSAKAHFVAHRLLTKMLLGEHKRKMYYALCFFLTNCKNHERKLSSAQYAVARTAMSLARKGELPSLKCRAAVSAARKNIPLSKQHRVRISVALQVQHTVYTLIGEKYEAHLDFYRFCGEHNIGRANAQAKMKSGVYVILAGKNKGICLAFNDIGAEVMHSTRDEHIQNSHIARSTAVSAVHKFNRENLND